LQPLMPVVLLLGASMVLGLWMAWQFLRRCASNPIHIGFHLILGVAGMEMVVMLLRGAPDGSVAAAGGLGKSAAMVLAIAVITGFATSVMARRWSRQASGLVLLSHAVVGTVGFVMFLVWAFNF
jgi:hypothetical protein